VSEADSTTTRKHIRLSKPLAEYAAASGKSDRALKNLIRVGKQQNNPVPFDDLPRMLDWWAACMKHTPPAWLHAWIATANPSTPGLIERDFSQVKGLSIEENVEGARKMHAINNLLLEEAHRSGNDNLVQQRHRNYQQSLNTLRTAELNLIEVQEARGGLIDKETVAAETAQLLEILKLQREQMPANILKDLARSHNRPLRRILRLIQPHLLASINNVRAQEDVIFRKLDAVDSTQTALDILEK
jgi:hypothetical protein